MATFVAELRRLTKYCDFGITLEDMLRDRLVCGVNDDRIQRRLLSELNLTFARAFELAQALESAEKHAKDLQQKQPSASIMAIRTKKETGDMESSDSDGGLCYRCKGRHAASTCRFRRAECHHCGKKATLQEPAARRSVKHTASRERHRTKCMLCSKSRAALSITSHAPLL